MTSAQLLTPWDLLLALTPLRHGCEGSDTLPTNWPQKKSYQYVINFMLPPHRHTCIHIHTYLYPSISVCPISIILPNILKGYRREKYGGRAKLGMCLLPVVKVILSPSPPPSQPHTHTNTFTGAFISIRFSTLICLCLHSPPLLGREVKSLGGGGGSNCQPLPPPALLLLPNEMSLYLSISSLLFCNGTGWPAKGLIGLCLGWQLSLGLVCFSFA